MLGLCFLDYIFFFFYYMSFFYKYFYLFFYIAYFLFCWLRCHKLISLIISYVEFMKLVYVNISLNFLDGGGM